MAGPVLVTRVVAGRTARPEAHFRPEGATVGAVVLASALEVAGFPPASLAQGRWIVLGEGELPEGFHPFLRLTAAASTESIGVAIDAALEVERLRGRLDALQTDATVARGHEFELARVGIALTAERDLDRLLDLILSTARELVGTDAGSLYLIEEHEGVRALRFTLAQNSSVEAVWSAFTVALDASSLAGYAALTGETVSVEDVRHLPSEVPYRFNPTFDLATGYHTRSILTAPIATRAGERIGVLQLINRKLDASARIRSEEAADTLVRGFGLGDVALIRALAAQAAVAIENSRLLQENQRLFEGFVRASVTAIEQRDPATSGHSLRVAEYCVALARALERHGLGPYQGVRFSPDELTQLRYAALLHDFGKVGVREAVLTKAKKLSLERLAMIMERFAHALSAREAELRRELLHNLERERRAAGEDEVAGVEGALAEWSDELARCLTGVTTANEPCELAPATAALLGRAASLAFTAEGGEPVRLLSPDELRALSIPRGSLTEEDRLEVQAHVLHSYRFLLTIPWPRRFARVPEIAYRHHESPNGRGYPEHLSHENIPVEARIMAICDMYDALVAADRPYKSALSHERAIGLLDEAGREGLLDPLLVKTFVEAEVFACAHRDSLAAGAAALEPPGSQGDQAQAE
ncbi:MAG: HD domain-containing phosphohydrolase [Acidobacteriota bacterium]